MTEEYFSTRLNNNFPSNEEKISAIMTFLGMAAQLIKFIHQTYKLDELPILVQYAMANICANMVALTSDEKILEKKDFTKDMTLALDEQTQEGIYRIMKIIILDLYEVVKERDASPLS